MKKIFGIFAAALIALSFASCGGNNNDPENKDFKITVDSITAISAYVKVEPTDTAGYYFWGVFDAKDAVDQPDDSIIAAVNEEIDYVIKFYTGLGYKLNIFDLLYKGVSDYSFSGLLPESDYVVCAVKFNEAGEAFGDITKKPFSTTKIEYRKENLTLSGYYTYDPADGYYEMEAWSADEKYDLWIAPDVKALDDDITMSDFPEPDYLYFAIGEVEYPIVDINLTASVANSVLKLNGTVKVGNGVEYTVAITAEEDSFDAAPARKTPARKDTRKMKINFPKR